jgi:hypothetical protein
MYHGYHKYTHFRLTKQHIYMKNTRPESTSKVCYSAFCNVTQGIQSPLRASHDAQFQAPRVA